MELRNLESLLIAKELDCLILNPISPENLGNIIKKASEKLEPYLDKNLDPTISKIPIKYYPQKQLLKIFYDGKIKSRVEILKILIKEFETNFAIISLI